MPSTYAHYRLGQKVLHEIPEPIRKIIRENKQLYDIGLHGPDILFYYHPMKKNKISDIGYEMHERSGRDFFENAIKILEENKWDERHLAYVYGFLCHFALDVTCHGYINEKMLQSGLSHAEIEVEFDRDLMVQDGLNPIKQKLTNHIIPTLENAQVITKFYPNTNELDIKTALKGMISYNNLLLAPTKGKRWFLNAALYISGNYKQMHGLIVNEKANPACEDSSKILNEKYKIATKRAIELISEYEKYFSTEQQWNPIYHLNFEGENGGQKYEV